jgi:hypothetical protein
MPHLQRKGLKPVRVKTPWRLHRKATKARSAKLMRPNTVNLLVRWEIEEWR